MAFVLGPFESADALVAQATKHVQKLKMRAQTFRDTHCSRPFSEIDPATGEVCLKIAVIIDPSPEIPCLVFDIVNEIRSALDYVVYDAALLITGLPEVSGTKFPFGDNADDTARDFNRKRPLPVLEGLRDFIIGEIQPYEGGRGEALWRLNKLRNTKIHRVLVPGAAAPGGLGFGQGTFSDVRTVNEWNPEKKELTFARARSVSSDAQMRATLQIAFVQGSPFPDRSVTGTMVDLTNIVRATVAKIREKAPELIPSER